MARRKLNLGAGATVSVISKFVHPSENIRNAFPNPVSGHRLEGCIVLRQKVQKVSGKQQLCVMITHEDFKNEDGSFFELYAVKKHFKVTLEGDPDKFFDLPNEGTGVNVSDEEEGVLAPPEGATHEELRGNVEMDDDNEPLPENIPAANNEEETAVLDAEWGHDGICFRKQMNLGVTKPRLLFPYDGTTEPRTTSTFSFSKACSPRSMSRRFSLRRQTRRLKAICMSDVLWSVDLRENKDRPPQLGPKQYDEHGKTTGTLLRLTASVHGTGKLFVLDSGFCVLNALV
jgi:Transposase IS4